MMHRRVVLLALGRLLAQVQELLISEGWQPIGAVEYQIATALSTDLDIHTGIIQLINGSELEIDRIEARTVGKSYLEWIALVPPELLSNKSICRLIKNRFYDYHTLPIDPARLLLSLGHAYGKGRLTKLIDDPVLEKGKYGMIGISKVMRDLYSAIEKTGDVDAPALISGESGTGKELVANSIHQLSARRHAPLVAVNCAALPANLIQSELFGHEKGAFTGAQQCKIGRLEAAAGGTVFLDEIGDLPLELQVNLLRVLQNQVIQRLGSNREIQLNVRIIAASHVNLEKAVRQGRFREDLYYRLNVLSLNTPPLRERESDMELLAINYFEKFSRESHGIARGFSRQALGVMGNYAWPGNVRELINRVRRAVIMSENRLLTPGDLGLEKRVIDGSVMTLYQTRVHAEQEAIRRTLRRNQNNVTASACQLGVSRATLYRLLARPEFISSKDCIDQDSNDSLRL